ncbi:NADH dehydrogenase [ubiquinone] 1 subunit C2 [Trematomus bernacchii]|uniref:NADH dehydrogenase [ubiquinone] 1 subunit C2 n=1 Tax=Trematomus bernacchii TaxID=40690 RepID=UPI00146D9F9B|nr:NADH dehydrogenase [ubiquinone] 1 subunit C2 [Trematomus bernacchii]
MWFLPEEAKALPPPSLFNRNSAWLALSAGFASMLHNAINHKPPLKSGVHRLVLMTTIGWYVGYHVTKREHYHFAKVDRDMTEYIKLHPDNFVAKDKKTFAEIVEPFNPIR